MKLKYINSDYVPKGELEGFPLEVIDKMLERQVEQGNEPNVEVFETSIRAGRDFEGFRRGLTTESEKFWGKVLIDKDFEIFFEKYPKNEEESKSELPLPRVVEVKFSDDDRWKKRVVITFRNNKALCWETAESVEDAENKWAAMLWEEWREVQEETKPEYKPFDFSDGIKHYSFLVGQKLFSKKDDSILMVYRIRFDNETGQSFIDGIDAEYIFEDYTFEDGTPVGAKI